MDSFSVFYLVGGYSNFVCKSVVGKLPISKAEKEVESLVKMGYKAMGVKNGHIIGGYCSYSDFETLELAKDYYYSL